MPLMDITPAIDYRAYFHQSVLADLTYWREYLQAKQHDVAALLRKRPQILKTIQYTLTLAEAWPTLVYLFHELAPYMERWGYWGEWAQLLDEALAISRQQHDIRQEIKVLVFIARLAQRQSQSRQVICTYRQVLRLARQVHDEENMARACSNLAYCYTEMGSYGWRAEILGHHALAIFNRLGHIHGQAHTHNHLGLYYTRLGQWALAESHLQHAYQLWQGLGDKHGQARAELNLGLMYNDKQEPTTALIYLKEALTKALSLKEEVDIATIYLSMGVSYRLHHDGATAKTYFWQAETILRATGNLLRLAHVQVNLGLVYSHEEAWDMAKPCFLMALALYQTLKHHYYEITTWLYLVKFDLKQSHYEAARDHLQQAELRLAAYVNNPFYHHLVTQATTYHQQLQSLKSYPCKPENLQGV